MTAILRRRSNMKMPLFISEESQEPVEPVITDYSQEYLTLEVVTDGTIGLKTNGSIGSKTLSYKINNGEWTSISTSASNGGVVYIQNLVAGDKVKFKGSNNSYASSKNNYMNFEGGTATFNIWGNIMSLTNGDNFASATSLTGTFNFCSIFKLSPCLSAENLILPVLTLTEACYRAMFSKATLTVAPKILPATTLAQYVYWYMFEECPIITAPELPFTGTLPAYSYGYMFTGCTNLNYVKCLATNISATSATTGWLTNVAKTGTFIKNSDMSGWSTGVNGIPSGWTTQDNTHDYSQDYFTIVSRANSNVIKLMCAESWGDSYPIEVEVSTDNGNTWTTKESTTSGVTLATLNNGDKLLVRGQNSGYAAIESQNEFVEDLGIVSFLQNEKIIEKNIKDEFQVEKIRKHKSSINWNKKLDNNGNNIDENIIDKCNKIIILIQNTMKKFSSKNIKKEEIMENINQIILETKNNQVTLEKIGFKMLIILENNLLFLFGLLDKYFRKETEDMCKFLEKYLELFNIIKSNRIFFAVIQYLNKNENISKQIKIDKPFELFSKNCINISEIINNIDNNKYEILENKLILPNPSKSFDLSSEKEKDTSNFIKCDYYVMNNTEEIFIFKIAEFEPKIKILFYIV